MRRALGLTALRLDPHLFLMAVAIAIVCVFSLSGCGEDMESESMFPGEIANERGQLRVLNKSAFIGATIAGTRIEHEINLFAAGGLDLTQMTATISTADPITFLGGEYPGEGGTCGSILASGARCKVVIVYEPADTSSHAALILFTFRDAIGPGSLTYLVSADSHPILQFEYGTLYDFGNKFIGTSTDLKIKITNVGRVPAESIGINNLSAPFTFRGGSYPGTGGTCGSRLDLGDTCDIIVRYSPANNGEHRQDITLTYLNSGRQESNTLNLLAWGFLPAQLTASHSSGIDFSTVAAGHAHSFVLTITHSGGDVSATNLTVSGLSTPFSRIGGTCSTTLAKSIGSCTMILRLSTTSSGTWGQSFTINYHDGKEARSITRTISGVTKQKAVLAVSPSGTVTYPTVKTGTYHDQVFTLTYSSGELPATGIGFTNTDSPYRYAGGSYPGTGGTCGSSLSSGSCTLVFRFAPTDIVADSLPQSRNLNYHDGYEQRTIAITLNGKTQGRLFWSSGSSPVFGDVVVGQTKSVTLSVSFQGGAEVTNITASSLEPPFSFVGGLYPGTGGTCSTKLSTGTCSIKLNFSPTAAGSFSPELNLQYFNGVEPQTLSTTLTGAGKSAAFLTIADGDFGMRSLNSVSEADVKITNTSSMAATNIATVSLPTGFTFKGGSYPGTGGTCSSSLSAGGNCNLRIVFSPVENRAYSGTMSLNYNDGTGTKSATATLSGQTELTSNVFLSGFDTYTFSSTYVGQSRSTTFTLSHGGSSTPATIDAKMLSLPSDYTIADDTCPSSLVNGGKCTFRVVFAPTAKGTRSSSLQVSYSDGTDKQVTRLLSGTGSQPAVVTITPSTHDYGMQPTDATYERDFSVSRSGDYTPPSYTVAYTNTAFATSTNGCGSSPASPCTIRVRFSPTEAKLYNGKLSISYNNGFETRLAYADLSGTGKPTGVLNFAAASSSFGSAIQSTTVSRTITVNHSGSLAASAMSPVALTAPFHFKDGTYPGTGGTCGTSLASGSCTMVVDFKPTVVGVFSQTLALNYNNGTSTKQITHTLSGTAVAQAILSLSESSPLSFPGTAAGGTADKTITLLNGGGTTATGIGATFENSAFSFKGGNFPGTGGTCTSQVNPGSSCTIVIQFRPTAATSYNGSMTLNYHDGLRIQSELLELKGTGL
jgi:hypothetical protein